MLPFLPAGILDRSRWQVGQSVMRQSCELLEEMGPDGISQQDLGRKLGFTKLEARAICRNFERRHLVITVMKDQGWKDHDLGSVNKWS